MLKSVFCTGAYLYVGHYANMNKRRKLQDLFRLPAPAAMKRGGMVPRHGDAVPYGALWSHAARREGDQLPPHQQASGINAGVMLLEPDDAAFRSMEAEVRDWYHPEHYGTYMPEQEYLGRFCGTFSRWTHVDCRFNFEVDKNERIPHDFTEAHELIRAGGAPGHGGAAVLHYSGTGVKPWDLLFERRGDQGKRLHQSAPTCFHDSVKIFDILCRITKVEHQQSQRINFIGKCH